MKYLCLIYQNEETSARNAQQGGPAAGGAGAAVAACRALCHPGGHRGRAR
jgi:hypothetical protein